MRQYPRKLGIIESCVAVLDKLTASAEGQTALTVKGAARQCVKALSLLSGKDRDQADAESSVQFGDLSSCYFVVPHDLSLGSTSSDINATRGQGFGGVPTDAPDAPAGRDITTAVVNKTVAFLECIASTDKGLEALKRLDAGDVIVSAMEVAGVTRSSATVRAQLAASSASSAADGSRRVSRVNPAVEKLAGRKATANEITIPAVANLMTTGNAIMKLVSKETAVAAITQLKSVSRRWGDGAMG